MKKQLPITIYPKNSSLHERCREVTDAELATKEIKELIRDMIHTMYKDDGVGIAAPQVGKNIRLAIITKATLKHADESAPFSTKKDLVIVNPAYTPLNADKAEEEEGCLSTPGVWGSTPRHTKILVRFATPEGEHYKCIVTDFLARVFQHEIDHLNGVLFIDRARETHEAERKPKYPTI
ncbi:MAG: peptide deformylase [Patescibacteria group bacterium]